MNGWLEYLTGYVAIGLVMLLLCRLITWVIHRKRDDQSLLDSFKAIEKEIAPKNIYREALNTAGIFLMVLLIWPIAVAVVAHELTKTDWSRVARKEIDPEKKFYAKGCLIKQISATEAENLERYIDPLGRCPALPFGHLNIGWKKFLNRQPQNAALWSFHRETDDKSSWSFDRANGIGRGYCWVINGKVVDEIVIEG